MIKYSFPPIADENCKVVILGTMPGEESLKHMEYYNSSNNQFWKIIAAVTGESFNVSYDEKKKLLLKHHIAVWDVLMHCNREGSQDANIIKEAPNDFNAFFEENKSIKTIFFNGEPPHKFYKKYHLPVNEKKMAVLTSSSGLNTSKTLQQKIEIWNNLIKTAL